MIIAFYIPEELAESYRKERFQPTLARLRRYAKQAGTPSDLKIVQQLEASFCVSRKSSRATAEFRSWVLASAKLTGKFRTLRRAEDE